MGTDIVFYIIYPHAYSPTNIWFVIIWAWSEVACSSGNRRTVKLSASCNRFQSQTLVVSLSRTNLYVFALFDRIEPNYIVARIVFVFGQNTSHHFQSSPSESSSYLYVVLYMNLRIFPIQKPTFLYTMYRFMSITDGFIKRNSRRYFTLYGILYMCMARSEETKRYNALS